MSPCREGCAKHFEKPQVSALLKWCAPLTCGGVTLECTINMRGRWPLFLLQQHDHCTLRTVFCWAKSNRAFPFFFFLSLYFLFLRQGGDTWYVWDDEPLVFFFRITVNFTYTHADCRAKNQLMPTDIRPTAIRLCPRVHARSVHLDWRRTHTHCSNVCSTACFSNTASFIDCVLQRVRALYGLQVNDSRADVCCAVRGVQPFILDQTISQCITGTSFAYATFSRRRCPF